MQIVWDIETDGLLHEMTKCHMIVCQDINTKTIYKFTNVDDQNMSIQDGLKFLDNATVLIGHNIIGFDIPALKKLFGYTVKENQSVIDTLVMSRVLNYGRPNKHGLGGWGEFLGYSKQDNTDFNADGWKTYSPKMLEYCIQDVKLNTKVYEKLLVEFNNLYAHNPLIKKGLRIEHDTAEFNAIVREQGWNFDLEGAKKVLKEMNDRMSYIESIIEPKLGTRKVYIDKLPKTPKYTKKGWYSATTARLLSEYFGRTILPEDAINNAPIFPNQEFQRSKVEQIKLGQVALVKDWLLDNGWKPDEYVRQRVDGQWISKGPKLTATSLKNFMGEIGPMIGEYFTTRNRAAVVEGWLEAQVNGRLHGDMITVGTPSMRCTHRIIVNLPANSVKWGTELRSLLRADDGWQIVGADSSGNQLRGLCHYVDDAEYTDLVINGDQHQRNADALGCSRDDAKTFLYSYLFGAGDAKLGACVNNGVMNPEKGRIARASFAKNVRGLDKMNTSVQEFWRNQVSSYGKGWIHGLDGRPIFVPAEHQCLNYLLQSAEGITCKAAISYAMKKIKEEGLRAKPRLFYHDEQAWTAHPDDVDRVGEILQESFKEAPKWFGVECMDGGDYVKGYTYADVH